MRPVFLAPLAVLAALLTGPTAALASPAAARAPSGSCQRHVVGGQRICLRVHRACVSGLQPGYLRWGFTCRKRRLARATPRDLRRGEALLVDARGRLGARDALEAFDAVIAPLKGVRARPGAVGAVRDGTPVVKALLGRRAGLTAAQRAALDRVTAARGAHSAQASGEKARILALAGEVRSLLAGHGWPITHRIEITYSPTDEVPDRSGQQAPAWEVPGWLRGTSSACDIFIAPTFITRNDREQRAVLAHEVFHCAQDERMHSFAESRSIPAWVAEGGAAWAGDTILREWTGTDTPRPDWGTWLTKPESDLFTRQYSAIGFFGLLQQSGVDVWSRMRAILDAAKSGSGAAYTTALQGAPATVYDPWGPGLLRDPARGASWDLQGPGLPGSQPPRETIDTGTTYTATTEPRGAQGVALSLQADVVTVSPAVEHGKLSTSAGEETLAGEVLCTLPDGCTCPDGGGLDAVAAAKGPAAIGWSDGTVTITGSSLDDACRRDPHRRPTPAPQDPSQAILMLAGDNSAIIARFSSGVCTVAGGTFTATASDAGYTLSIRIDGYTGPATYPVAFLQQSPGFTVTGGDGPYSNVYFPAGGTPPPGGGAIIVAPGVTAVSLGFVNAFNAATSGAVALGGGMTCSHG